jgi:hypothetical protein
MDKETGNRKRSTKGKVATERVQMGMSNGNKRKEKGNGYRGNNNRNEIGVKVKRQEKGEKEGCMERKAWERVEEFRIGEGIESTISK